MSRLFVAAWPPAPIVEELAALPRERVPGVRWTTPDQWHVTLRFLGEADPELAASAVDRLRHAPVEARLGDRPIGRLGRNVLMIPVGGLDSLASVVSEVASGLGRPEAQSGFIGHLTLARLKGAPACGLVGVSVRATWTVTEVCLVESTLRPSGASYRTVTTVPLR